MKKVLTTLVCILLVAAMAVGLFACNTPDDDGGETPLDIQGIFGEALAKLAGPNYTAEFSAQTVTGKDAKSPLYKQITRLTADGSDTTYIYQQFDGEDMAVFSEDEPVNDMIYFEEYFRKDKGTYYSAVEYNVANGNPRPGYENSDVEYDYFDAAKDAEDYSWLYSDYGQYILAMMSNYIFAEEDVTTVDGGYIFNLDLNLLPLLDAYLNENQSVEAYYNGIFAAVGSDLTIEGIVVALKEYQNDAITVGELADKLDALAKRFSQTLSFGKFLDLAETMYLLDARSENEDEDPEAYSNYIYNRLKYGGANISEPRDGENFSTYILRVVSENKDKKVAEVFGTSILGILFEEYNLAGFSASDISIDAALDMLLLSARNTNYLFAGRGGAGPSSASASYVPSLEDELRYSERTRAIVMSIFDKLQLKLSVTVIDKAITDIAFDFEMKADARDYIYACLADNVEGYTVPEGFDISGSAYEKDDTDEFLALVLIIHAGFGGIAEEFDRDLIFEDIEDNLADISNLTFNGDSGYKITASLKLSAYGSTELVNADKLEVAETNAHEEEFYAGVLRDLRDLNRYFPIEFGH